MAYGDTGVVFQWTNDRMRYPTRWTIVPYLSNSEVSADTFTTYDEAAMNTEFGRLVEIARTTKAYDQILVYRNDESVPSAGDTGTNGDVIP